jgi:hypothetical protein
LLCGLAEVDAFSCSTSELATPKDVLEIGSIRLLPQAAPEKDFASEHKVYPTIALAATVLSLSLLVCVPVSMMLRNWGCVVW